MRESIAGVGLRYLFFCPDRHLSYDGATPDAAGVGGGVTARIRLAAAVAAAGNQVEMVCNTPRARTIDAVRYTPLDDHDGTIDADVLFVQSSGGRLDVTPASALRGTPRLTVVKAAGPSPLRGLHELRPDVLVLASNYLRDYVVREWAWDPARTAVFPNGVHMARYRRHPLSRRDRHRIVYASHPAKGLDTALDLLARLRRVDHRFTLHVYGGAALWGQPQEVVRAEGVVDHGMVGQLTLAKELTRASFSMHMQDFPEAFGLTLAEAMAAGCVPVVSPVGALAERVADGADAVVVAWEHTSEEAREVAAARVLSLVEDRRRMQAMSQRASSQVLDWSAVGQSFAEFCEWRAGAVERHPMSEPCSACREAAVVLADGTHCTACGRYGSRAAS